LRGFEKHLDEFRRHGIAIAAISVDSQQESNKLCQSRGYTYPFLSDPHTEVIRSYGVLHPKGGENGGDIARPAEFFVDSAGIVRWVNLTDDIRIRARPERALEVILRQIGWQAKAPAPR
jgi:peroxiredoxin